jgi:hypothetical protein
MVAPLLVDSVSVLLQYSHLLNRVLACGWLGVARQVALVWGMLGWPCAFAVASRLACVPWKCRGAACGRVGA